MRWSVFITIQCILKYKKKEKKEKLDNSHIVSRFQKLSTYSKGQFHIDDREILIDRGQQEKRKIQTFPSVHLD